MSEVVNTRYYSLGEWKDKCLNVLSSSNSSEGSKVKAGEMVAVIAQSNLFARVQVSLKDDDRTEVQIIDPEILE